MSAYIRPKTNRIFRILAAAALLVLISLCMFLYELWIHMEDMTRTESELLAASIINSAVSEAVPQSLSREIISESCDDKGAVQSLSIDSSKANRINSLICDAVTEKLKSCEDESFSIPVGTLSGISFLSGRGFGVSLHLSCIGSVRTDITSDFVSCGINQSKYRVCIKISVRLSAILPMCTTEVNVDYNYVLGEKIIVGSVPQAYFSA